jgi:WD40 repeat protein
MSDMTPFENRFEARVRAFAVSGVTAVDAAAVAHSVSVGKLRARDNGVSPRWLGLGGDRRALVVVLAVGLLAAFVVGAIYGGSRLLRNGLLNPERQLVHLVYSSDGDLYVADPDGRNAVRIAEGDPTKPCGAYGTNGGLVSPDGRYLAYRSNGADSCSAQIVISDPTGHRITSVPGDGWKIAWSPDSTRFATWLEFGKTIGVYEVDGRRLAVLDGSMMAAGDYDPAWSPDGADAVIVERNLTAFEVPLDGGSPRPVPATDPRSSYGLNMNPVAYAPDRARVAYAAAESQIVIEGADGSDRKLFVADEPGNFVPGDVLWLPNGKRIAYVASRVFATDGYSSAKASQYDLRLLDPVTGQTSTLITVPRPVALRGVSPSGDRLLVGETDVDGSNASLWSVNTDGPGSTRLVDGAFEGEWMTAPADPTAH